MDPCSLVCLVSTLRPWWFSPQPFCVPQINRTYAYVYAYEGTLRVLNGAAQWTPRVPPTLGQLRAAGLFDGRFASAPEYDAMDLGEEPEHTPQDPYTLDDDDDDDADDDDADDADAQDSDELLNHTVYDMPEDVRALRTLAGLNAGRAHTTVRIHTRSHARVSL